MAICKKNFFTFILFLIITSILTSNVFGGVNDLKISKKNLIIIKYDIFFLKYQHRVLSRDFNFMVKYQNIEHDIEIDDLGNIKINIFAKMDVLRYTKKKKYKPKLADCNIIRNKILLNKLGYSLFTLKKNYSISENELFSAVKEKIYNFIELNDKDIDNLIDSTVINITIIHPIKKFNINCSGKISELELS